MNPHFALLPWNAIIILKGVNEVVIFSTDLDQRVRKGVHENVIFAPNAVGLSGVRWLLLPGQSEAGWAPPKEAEPQLTIQAPSGEPNRLGVCYLCQ